MMQIHDFDATEVFMELESEKTLLLRKLAATESRLLELQPYVDFVTQTRRLKEYLEAPTSQSLFAGYELGMRDLIAAKAQLAAIRSRESLLNNLLLSLKLPNKITNLENRINQRSKIIENLRFRLKLVGNMSLQEEFQRLNNHMQQLVSRGFLPQYWLDESRSATAEKLSLKSRLATIDEILEQRATRKRDDVISIRQPKRESQTVTAPKRSRQKEPSQKRPRWRFDKKEKTVFTDLNFWSHLESDLLSANKSVLIISPYLSTIRSNCYLEIFKTLIQQGVRLTVITKPPDENEANRSVIETLTALTVEVIAIPKIHQKIVLIDKQISWEGSMNWLSHRDTAEHIRRIDDRAMVLEVQEVLEKYLALRY